jgi:hypothetical protein
LRLIDKIHQKHKTICGYPDDVVPVYDRIGGTSFFPGGDGLWKHGSKNDDLTIGGVMVVGHNFDNISGFDKSLQMGTEPVTCATWRNIRKLLLDSKITLEDCYFTNVYVGLMKTESNVGIFPGSKSEVFKKQCIEFLEYQISVQRPSIILTLGRFVPSLIARLSKELSEWLTVQNVAQLDLNNKQIISGANFCDGNVVSTVIALTHPAQRHLNVGRRKYRSITGNEAEIAMLRDATAC